MNVVSNTSPLCYLLLIDQVELLPTLFGEIIVPQAVITELTHKKAPPTVKNWIIRPPAWLHTHTVTPASNPDISRLHPGEQEAIILAQNLSADLIILDEKIARQMAKEQGLIVTGLLGILDQAASQNLVDLPTAIDHLQQTNFRASPHILKSLLDRHFT